MFVVLSVLSNLLVLAVFKYSAFFYNSIMGTVAVINDHSFNYMESLIIPAGLSFYTFQSLSYTIDVYRGKYKAEDTLYDFLLFVSFFPHMVAGPVVRYNTLMPQLKTIHYFKNIEWESFAKLVIWGYFKKLVIADNLNLIVSPVFNDVREYGGMELLLAGFLFVIQVYCDFSGYSDIATGVAKLFKIDLSLNWRRPLLSRSLHEFWQRNHISITTWFRDYLYISLGGNRVTYTRWLVNIFLVFVISGFWHGANLTFVIWGSMHGVFFLGEVLLRKFFPAQKVPNILGWLYLIAFHTVSLIAFRANSVTDLLHIYESIFSGGTNYFDLGKLTSHHDKFFFLVMLLIMGLLFLKELNEEFAILNKYKQLYHIGKPALYLLAVVIIFVLGNFSANTFIYFQF